DKTRSPEQIKPTSRPGTGDEEQRLTEQQTIRRLLEGIKKLQKEGKLEAAGRKAADLAAQTPNSPVTHAANRIADTASRLAASQQLQAEQERRAAGTLAQVERSRTPPASDIDFPKDWKERTKKRSPETVPTTAKEKAILRALDSPISVQFRDTRFQDVIDYIQDHTGQTILLDKQAMEDAGVSYDTPVTLR